MTTYMIAEGLTVPETRLQKAWITHATAQLIRGLIDRRAAGSFTLTDQGRAATSG
jgi:hypothetical protein